MVREQVTAVLDPESEHDGNKANRDGGVKNHAERMRIRFLERRARRRHDRRGHSRHALKREGHAHGILNHRRDQRTQVVRAVARAKGGSGDVVAQILVDDRGQDGREDGVADGAAGAAKGAQQACAQAQLLDGDEQARGDVRQRRDPGEAALPKQLHRAPGHLVAVGGLHDGGVGAGKGTLQAERHDDLVPDVADLVHEAGEHPAAQDAGHGGRDHEDTDFEGVVGEDVEGGLGPQGHDGLPDHAGEEEDGEVDGELAGHGEEFEGEDGRLAAAREVGEVVDKGGNEDDGPEGDGHGDTGGGEGGVTEVGHADEEDGQARGEEEEADKVEVLELLPAGAVVVVLGPRGRVVEGVGACDADDGVDDGNVVAPPPGGVGQEQGGEVDA